MEKRAVRPNLIFFSLFATAFLTKGSFGQEHDLASSPCVVNLHLKQALPENVFKELAKQGDIKIIPDGKMWDAPSMQTGIDMDFTDKPFWAAFREACALWNCVPQPMYGRIGTRQIMLQPWNNENSWALLPTYESNGFLIQATNFVRTATISYASPNQSGVSACNLSLAIYIDPALRILSIDRSPKVLEAVDDAGHSLLAWHDANEANQQMGTMIYICNVPMSLPTNVGKKIAHVKCVLNLLAGANLQTLVVEKPLTAAETQKSFGNANIVFHSMAQVGSQYEVKISIVPLGEERAGESWGMAQMCRLYDAKGREFLLEGPHGGVNSDHKNEMTLSYLIDTAKPQGQPAKWAVELPFEPKPMQIPIEFKDLPLP